MKNKKILVLAASLTLAVVMVLTGTFAWFTTNDSVVNKLKTTDAPSGAQIVEVFTPPTDWKPGQSIIKEVGVVNTGDAPVLTRIHFEEVLKLINPAAAEADIFNAAAETAGKLPQLFKKDLYVAANGWYPVTTVADTTNLGDGTSGLKLSAAVPTGVKVFAKMTKTGSAATNNLQIAYAFATYAEITAGTYAGQAQHTNAAYDFDSSTLTLTVRGAGAPADPIAFMTYSGKTTFNADWATDLPTATGLSVAENKAKLVPTAGIANYIELNYSAALVTTGAASTWFYNDADGYFYYIGMVNPGTATANLLNSLTLNSAAGNEYANMDFDLVVKMDAIQNTKDAAMSVWGMTATDFVIEKLAAANAFE